MKIVKLCVDVNIKIYSDESDQTDETDEQNVVD